mgnify:CR=1 FL=1
MWVLWANTALEVNDYVIESEKIPESFDGFRIAQVSDLHNAEFWTDVVDIYSVSDLSVGVRKDGTLITTGGSTWNIEEIDTWTGVMVADS